MKFFIAFIYLFVNLLCIQVNGQNKDLIEVETIVKKSQQKYDAAKKKIYRAEEKLIHLKKIGVLSYNELNQKELLLQKAKNKLEQMRLLLEHNTTLISQTKTNPSFGKSIRSNNSIANAKSQKKSIQDIQQEKIQKLREQQKQALVSKVKENRNKIKQQQTKAKSEKAISKPKKNKASQNKKQQSGN